MEGLTKLLARIVRVELVLLVLFGLGELGCRLWISRFATDEDFRRYASIRDIDERGLRLSRDTIVPHRYIGYTPAPGYRGEGIEVSRAGFRGRSLPEPGSGGELRVALLGGSAAYGAGLTDEETLARRLEQRLIEAGVEARVLNAACEGWTSYESLLNLELRMLTLDLDLCVVYHGVEEVDARLVWPSSAYRGDDSGYREALVGTQFRPPAWHSSALLRTVAVAAGWIPPHADALSPRNLLERFAATSQAQTYIDAIERGEVPGGVFDEVSPEGMLAANPPIYLERNLQNIVAVARANGIEVVFATCPASAEFSGEPRASSRPYQRGLEETNETIRAVAEETGAPLCDVAAAELAAEHFQDGLLPNAAGADALAAHLAAFLTERGLLER